jgi:NADH-quinone oxidoreductase subunit G
MIEEAGLDFKSLEPDSLDMPFGFKTGAGVIFGNSGGVSEAVLRFVTEKTASGKTEGYEFHAVRGEEGVREATINLNGKDVTIAVVHGLRNARNLVEKIKAGESRYQFVEVMACPGGCISGAGQPVYTDAATRRKRTRGIYENDKMHQLHKPQENPYVQELYKNTLGTVGGHKAHHMLHTHYGSRKRISSGALTLKQSSDENKVTIDVCFGTGCFIKGSQKILKSLVSTVEECGMKDLVEVKASFCYEKCAKGPVVKIGGQTIERCTVEKAIEAFNAVCEGAKENGSK